MNGMLQGMIREARGLAHQAMEFSEGSYEENIRTKIELAERARNIYKRLEDLSSVAGREAGFLGEYIAALHEEIRAEQIMRTSGYAGGITDAKDWQAIIKKELTDTER